MNWYLQALKKYAVFNGRAQRSEFWFFVLFYMIGFFITGFLDGMLGTFNEEIGFGLFSGVFLVGHIIPSISVSVRRLHDIGKSGWWYLLNLIPLIGPIVLIVFAVFDSAPDNEYGIYPKLAPQQAS